MDDLQTTAQVTEGVAGETASQGSEPAAQAVDQNQQDTSTKVDGGESQASSEPDARPKASQFVAGRREIRRLENQIAQIQQMLQANTQSQQPPAPGVRQQPVNPEDFYKDPHGYIQRMMDEYTARLKGEIPRTLEERERTVGLQRNLQEAERMIVTNETVKKDPQGMDRIKDILYDEDFGLNEMSKVFPVQAARLALQLYNQRYVSGVSRRPSAAPPTKAQMQTTATAVNGGGKKANIGDEYTKLRDELMANPLLANDVDFVSRLNALKSKRKLENTSQ